MLRKFAAALLATALIAGPALAQTSTQAPGNAGSTAAPAAAAASTTGAKVQTKAASTVKSTKTASHIRKHVRKHLARGKTTTMKQARHVKSTKTHQIRAAKSHARVGVKTAKLPATRNSTN
jgi:hypothetical protein